MKKIINFLVLILLTIIVLYFSLKDNFSEVLIQLKTLNKLWIILAFLLVIGYWFFQSLSMKKFANNFNKNFKLKQAFKITLTTQFFNAITPFASGGQPYQLYALKSEKISIVNSTNIIIENFIVYQIALMILGIIAVITNSIFDFYTEIPLLKNLVLLGFSVNLFVTVLLFITAFTKKTNKKILKFFVNILYKIKIIKNKEEILDKYNDHINKFHDGAKKLIKDKKQFTITIIYNFIALILFYTVPLIILYSMNDFTSLNLPLTIITSAYVMLIGAFIPMPGGTGGLEYGFISFFGFFIANPKLTTVMLLWRFITYYFGMIVGAITLNIKRKRS